MRQSNKNIFLKCFYWWNVLIDNHICHVSISMYLSYNICSSIQLVVHRTLSSIESKYMHHNTTCTRYRSSLYLQCPSFLWRYLWHRLMEIRNKLKEHRKLEFHQRQLLLGKHSMVSSRLHKDNPLGFHNIRMYRVSILLLLVVLFFNLIK